MDCPVGYDPDVWDALPEDIQKEALEVLRREGATRPAFYLNKLRRVGAGGNDGTLDFHDAVGPVLENVQRVILSSFQFDEDFALVRELKRRLPRNCEMTLVMHPGTKGPDGVKCVFPRLQPGYNGQIFGSMHAKFILIQRPQCLRVVITSANLGKADWLLLGQTIWFQDFPQRSSGPIGGLTDSTTHFGRDLIDFVQSLSPRAIDTGFLHEYDFSLAKVFLIRSIPGRHRGAQLDKYGHMALRKVLANYQWPAKDASAPVEAQISSVGNLTRWAPEFLQSCNGGSRPPAGMGLHVVFPSKRTVWNMRYGLQGSSCMCLQAKHWEAPGFPRELFHDVIIAHRGRDGYLLHSKTVHRQYKVGDRSYGWLYTGSHNLSPSAWGRLETPRGSPQLHITNYELGILFPPTLEETMERFPIPHRTPALPYDQVRPWLTEKDLEELLAFLLRD